jgi:ABC-type nitrate/sulfonate/bicarbonate transport system ATPase subunit
MMVTDVDEALYTSDRIVMMIEIHPQATIGEF